METIKKTTRIKDHYEIECEKCGKVVEGVSVKAVRHSYRMHQVFCKSKKKTEENQNGISRNVSEGYDEGNSERTDSKGFEQRFGY